MFAIIQPLLTAANAQSVLLVSPAVDSELMAYCTQSGLALTHLTPGAALPAARFDIVVVDLALDTLTQSAGRELLGALRNCLSDDLVVTTKAEYWQLADFIALGFQQETAAGELRVYRYRLASYNHQRSWNNSRFWANPQNFNRFRW